MARIDLYAVRELEQPLKAQEHPARALVRRRGEVGAGCVAHQERVACDDEPGLVSARPVDDGETAVLGPVSRCVQNANRDLAELELLTVLERVVVELGLGLRMNGNREAVLEGQAAVTRDVIGVGVRLEHAHQSRLLLLRLGQVLPDCVGRVDDDRRPRGLVSDQVGRAAEIVVDELAEEHERELNRAVLRFYGRSARARGASRSPCAALRSCPRRSPGSSDPGRAARLQTPP